MNVFGNVFDYATDTSVFGVVFGQDSGTPATSAAAVIFSGFGWGFGY